MIVWRLFADFSEWEFICHCGCGRADMDTTFMHALQSLRTQLGFIFTVASGFRCPEHNARVSTTGLTGPHTTGAAADIRAFHQRAGKIIFNMRDYGFAGLGVSQKGEHAKRFLHLDMARDSFQIWSY